jgi:adenylate cyclase
MDALTRGGVFLFEGFRLDRQARVLLRRDKYGAFAPIAIGWRALEVLEVLVERAGDVVLRDEFMAAVWPATVVEDTNLNMQIAALRRVLDEGRASGSCIQTIPGRGYRFVSRVTPEDGGARRRLSIVVLPFANLSDDREQQYWADGITDDVTTDLSRLADMFVISRNIAFAYRNKPVDTKQIGRELGVRYVLEGSVLRSGNQVRVNAQLIDAETDTHLWAERFERELGDLFALQTEITRRIAWALHLELLDTEAGRPSEHPDAREYILRGHAAYAKPPTRDNFAEAIGLFERALALDPGSVDAKSLLAGVLLFRVLEFPADSSDSDIERSEELAAEAVAASPRSMLAHWAKANVLRLQRRCAEAAFEYETVLALNRNWVGAIAALAWCKLLIGSIEETIPLLQQAIRFSPRDPYISVWYYRIGFVHLLQARIDEAILWLEKSAATHTGLATVHAGLASTYALKNEIEPAHRELVEARRLDGGDRYSSIALLKAAEDFGVPKIRALVESTYFAGLRKAGMPEEGPAVSTRRPSCRPTITLLRKR